ncbi:MAG: DNA gyrase subunit A [Candidatus Spechtbacteria bacterium RIFCSPLOWO2_02_FULL_38_8]|uniref:DNA gyrase subunit A n=1 Tax=Candidatus Spechtbacteria bacterium RIFCSPLOWO2_02_FULL_38_8 TaxID=1802164 RepID=A0A1G2HHA1_9BACT|nr:MAG: DNA gyrase subunit A [Candidatus Spechtbacteria bacterium RIFCSPLOWO2_02_FULL_38_8]
MPKKEQVKKPELEKQNIQIRPLVEEMQDSYLSYAMSVIMARALPDVRDGLKPVHRRILYTMHRMGLNSSSRFRKSAAITGETMGKYHPHGNAAIYDAMARMAQDFSMRYPLVLGQGNFGSIDGDNPAAERYTEAKLRPITSTMLDDIDKDTVEWMDNYDGEHKEPRVLPSALPQLLLNGTLGIAVGMATNIPPHNLKEIIDATTHLLANPKATVEDLMKFIQGPDFPLGGIIYDKKAMLEAYGQGKGPIVMRGKAEIKEYIKKKKKGGLFIEISEIPYQVNKSILIEKMAELVQTGKLESVRDIRDESDRQNSVRIIIELKKDAQPQKTLNKLYKYTELQKTFHLNMTALVGGVQPQVLNLKEVLEKYLQHKREVLRRRTEFELAKAKERAHILEGLKKALDNIDKVIDTIKKSKDRQDAHKNLKSKFKFTDIQITAILDMRLHNLANLERKKVDEELKDKKALIKEYEALLGSEAKIKAQIRKELTEISDKYGDERRTKVYASAVGKFSEEDLVPKEETIISMTRDGYIKRVSPSAYKVQHRGGKGIIGMETRGDDVVDQFLSASTHDRLLFFTNTGRVFQALAHEIPSSMRTARGKALVNFLDLQKDEFVTTIVPLTRGEKSELKIGSYLVMVTENGILKKTPAKDFENVRRSGLIAIRLKKDDKLNWVGVSSGNDEIILTTKNGQNIRFSEKDVRSMGRSASGVRGINLKADDRVVSSDIIKGEDKDKNLLIVMANGYGKQTALKLFKQQRRGGSGIKAASVTQKTGDVVGVRVVRDMEELIAISEKGQVIRVLIKKISKLGRATQGVRIMRLLQSDKVASVALV